MTAQCCAPTLSGNLCVHSSLWEGEWTAENCNVTIENSDQTIEKPDVTNKFFDLTNEHSDLTNDKSDVTNENFDVRRAWQRDKSSEIDSEWVCPVRCPGGSFN